MAAVVLADLAVETAAKAAWGFSAQPEIIFRALVKLVDAEVGSQGGADAGLSSSGRVAKLRALRRRARRTWWIRCAGSRRTSDGQG